MEGVEVQLSQEVSSNQYLRKNLFFKICNALYLKQWQVLKKHKNNVAHSFVLWFFFWGGEYIWYISFIEMPSIFRYTLVYPLELQQFPCVLLAPE